MTMRLHLGGRRGDSSSRLGLLDDRARPVRQPAMAPPNPVFTGFGCRSWSGAYVHCRRVELRAVSALCVHPLWPRRASRLWSSGY